MPHRSRRGGDGGFHVLPVRASRKAPEKPGRTRRSRRAVAAFGERANRKALSLFLERAARMFALVLPEQLQGTRRVTIAERRARCVEDEAFAFDATWAFRAARLPG